MPRLRFDELLTAPADAPEPGRFSARDGAELPCRYYPAHGAPLHLVFVHGSGSHGRYLAPFARAVSASGVAHVHTPDLRGHGLAPARRGDVDYAGQLEDDLADLVADVRARYPGARVAVGGHSSGGGLALRLAGGRQGAGVAGLLLLAPFLRHDAPTTRRGTGGWARPRVARIVLLRALGALGIHALDHLPVIDFGLPPEARDGSETLAYSHRLNEGIAPRDYRTDLAALRVPLLVLVGSEDEVFVPDRYAPTVGRHAPAAEVRVLPDLTHLGLAVAPAAAEAAAHWLRAL